MAEFQKLDINRRQHPFLRNNQFIDGKFDEPNTSGEFTLEQGTVMARVASSGKLVRFDSTAIDGSQIPVGVATQDYTMAGGATDVDISVCVSGDVKESVLKMPVNNETLDTVVTIDAEYTRTVRDMIAGTTQGIHLISFDELSEHDN